MKYRETKFLWRADLERGAFLNKRKSMHKSDNPGKESLPKNQNCLNWKHTRKYTHLLHDSLHMAHAVSEGRRGSYLHLGTKRDVHSESVQA